MSSTAIIGKGTTLGYAAYPTPVTYTTVAELMEVGLPKVTVSDVKVTHYGTSGNLHEYIAGWGEGGEVSAKLNYTKAEHDALLGLLRTQKTWKITLPDASTYIFGGYIKDVGGSVPNEDKITTEIVIKVISTPDFTPGA